MSDKIRSTFIAQLKGDGIDIGPLHRPMGKHENMNVQFVDKFTVEEMRANYPELSEFDLVEPDILDDAETLNTIFHNQFDFVIASHVIEHCKDPIKALSNWLRVLKPDGLLYLVVPDYRKTFDKYRKLTTLNHLIADYESEDIEQASLPHYYEYAELVNKKFFGRNIEISEEAEKLIRQDYSIHFHTYTPDSFDKLLQFINSDIRGIKILEKIANAEDNEFHYLVGKA